MEVFHGLVERFDIRALNTLFGYFCILSVLLLLGKLLRGSSRLLQAGLIPASMIGGFLGLALGPYGLGKALGAVWPGIEGGLAQVTLGISKLPVRLIDVVFATMFLGVAIPSPRAIVRASAGQLAFAMLIGGSMQYVVGALITAGILIPLFHVDPTFAVFIEVGFCGGPGTAAGMAQAFKEGYRELGWAFPDGADLLFATATIGILTATIVGMALVRLAIKRGFVKNPAGGLDGETDPLAHPWILPKESRYSIASATVSPVSIEPLALHMALVFVAMLFGYALDAGLSLVGSGLALLTGKTLVGVAFDAVPTFPLTMLGGLFLQLGLTKAGMAEIVDKDTLERIQGASLEFLVVAAIASINLPVLAKYFLPLLVLITLSVAFITLGTLYFGPRIFKQAWFERSIVEFGMQTGVAAMGLMLLRVVDPRFKSGAIESFGLKQMIYEPFFGGGFVTAMAPLLVLVLGLPCFAAVMFGLSALVVGLWWLFEGRKLAR
jgi:ESS family glutamate:Na+ symporter